MLLGISPELILFFKGGLPHKVNQDSHAQNHGFAFCFPFTQPQKGSNIKTQETLARAGAARIHAHAHACVMEADLLTLWSSLG